MKVIYNKILANFLKSYAKYENKAFRIFSVIGFLLILKTIPKIFKQLLPLWRRRFDIDTYGKDSHAVITGATEGIGKAFAQVLASKGFNLCLISRSFEKLRELKKELSEKYHTKEIHLIVADFTKSTDNLLFERIENDIATLDVSILVNNVGVGYVDFFNEVKESHLHEVLTVNCFPIVILTSFIIKQMNRRSKKSAIINLSSAASAIPYPYMSLYSAVKAFDDNFSRSLAREVPEKIQVISLRPLFVTTAMNIYKKSLDAITPKDCVDACLTRLATYNQTYGHWKHTFLANVIDIIPEGFRMFLLKVLGRYIVKNEREKRIKMKRV